MGEKRISKFTIKKAKIGNSKSLQSTKQEKDSLEWGKIWRPQKVGFHFSLVKSRRRKLVSNIFFHWLYVEEKEHKLQVFLPYYSQSRKEKTCVSADEINLA